MSELNPKAVYATMQEDARRGPLSKTLLAARIVAITAAVGGAVPTAMTAYQSVAHGIPFNEVNYRLEQYNIWVRNFDCRIDYRALTTAQGTRVDAGACGKTGDIAIKVTTPQGKAAYEWIAFTKLQKSGLAKAGLAEYLIGSAHAETVPIPRAGERVAQASPAPAAPAGSPAGMKVICEAMPSKATVVRIVQDGAKCYREQVAILRGALEKREEVACTQTCK